MPRAKDGLYCVVSKAAVLFNFGLTDFRRVNIHNYWGLPSDYNDQVRGHSSCGPFV